MHAADGATIATHDNSRAIGLWAVRVRVGTLNVGTLTSWKGMGVGGSDGEEDGTARVLESVCRRPG